MGRNRKHNWAKLSNRSINLCMDSIVRGQLAWWLQKANNVYILLFFVSTGVLTLDTVRRFLKTWCEFFIKINLGWRARWRRPRIIIDRWLRRKNKRWKHWSKRMNIKLVKIKVDKRGTDTCWLIRTIKYMAVLINQWFYFNIQRI